MPKTKLGKWSVGLGITLATVMVIELIFAFAIKGDSAVVDNSPTLKILAAILSIIFTLSAPLSFIFGLITVIKYKETSIWKPMVILYAFSLLMFILGEFLFSH